MKSFISLLFLLISYSGFSQTLTEVLYPKYVQGVGTSNAADDRKVPFVCRMTVAGLTPGTTYRYYNRFVADPLLATNGQGNYIIANPTGDFVRVTSATLAVVGRYGEFTTDGTGSYTGWFIVEPSLALEFQPGTQLYFRLMLNNGAGGGSVATRVTSSTPVTVLGWGSGANQGTGLRTIPNPSYVPKNLIFIFDNPTGTGRPESGTFVENDGTDNNAVTSGYAPFYANNVDGVNNTWGTILPNNLATGVRRIAQYSLASGALFNSITTTDGVYPTIPSGNVNTSNASTGLNEIVIAAIVVPVKLISFTATKQPGKMARLQWSTATEVGFSKFIIEKSSNGIDFTSIGAELGKGDNSAYQFDNALWEGVNYYRLRMVDMDGTFSYSRIATLNGDQDMALSVYPNPGIRFITITHPTANTNALIQIITMTGAKAGAFKVKQGEANTVIDVSKLQAGKYILLFTHEGTSLSTQFSKL